MKYYVYLLLDGTNPFYVGKGCGNRMYEHYRKAKNTKIKSPVLSKIRSMIKKGKNITYLKKLETDDESESFKYETELIHFIGRKDLGEGPLCNLTNGGEGVCNYKWTDNHRKNLSNSIKKAIREKRFTPGFNFERTAEYNNKVRNGVNKFWASENGKKQKEELSKKGKGSTIHGKRILSDDAREKMRKGGIKGNEIRYGKHNTT